MGYFNHISWFEVFIIRNAEKFIALKKLIFISIIIRFYFVRIRVFVEVIVGFVAWVAKKSFYFNGFGCCVPSWIVIIEVKGCSATGI